MTFLFFFILLFLTAIAADYCFWRRHRASLRRHRWAVVWMVGSHLPLLVMILSGWLARDNTTGLMLVSIWLFWIWLLLTLPRLVCYLFRRMHLPRAGIAVGVGVAGSLIWGATIGRTTLHVSRTEICSAKLPAAFDGFRIVQLSDMHIGTLVSPERELQRIVDSVEALQEQLREDIAAGRR